MEQRMRKNEFSFNDFLTSMDQMQNMGGLETILGMFPGVNKKMLNNANFDERQIDYFKAIILSMTDEERDQPAIINPSRKKRIAKGSGRPLSEVNKLLKQFNEMKKMMKQFTGNKGKGKKGRKGNPFAGMNLPF